MPASERGLAKNQGAREAKIKSARKNQAPLDSTAQTGRQADNDRGRNHRGVEEGRQIRRGSGKRKTGARRANAPKMRGSRIEEQRHRRANGLRTALCLSAAKTGATGAVALRRANDAARGKGEKTSRQTHADAPPPKKKKNKERARRRPKDCENEADDWARNILRPGRNNAKNPALRRRGVGLWIAARRLGGRPHAPSRKELILPR